jgi:hypothetical protein
VDLEERLKEYRNIETNLRNTLLTAERVTSEAKENARKEASLIVRGAEVDAEKAAEAIRAHTQQLRREVLELKRQKDNYMTRFKTLLESHHRVLDGFQEDFATVDREIEEIGEKVEADLNKGVPNRRMSRQKITEEFGHAPKDKVTWGDERRREDEPRPTMPRPGSTTEAAPKKPSLPHEDDMDETPPVSEAQTSLLDGDQSYRPNHVDVEPVGAMNEGSTVDAPPRPRVSVRPAGDQAGPAGRAAPVERNSEEVRRSVARSIEKQLYPEGGPDRAAGTRTARAPEPATDHAPAGDVVKDQREVRTEGDQDQWKQYEVRGKKVDWKDYDIAGTKPQQPPSGKKRHAIESDEGEVEEALSGLKEFSSGKDRGQPPQHADEEVMTLDNEVAETEEPHEAQAPPPRRQSSEKGKAERREAGSPEQEETEWSIEELRKNLSNFGRDEGN